MYLKFLFPAAIVSIVALFIFIPKVIKIDKIECSTQYGICPTDIGQKLEEIKGLSLDKARAKAKQILESEHQLSEYSLHFNLPQTLKVDILVRKPKFAIRNDSLNSVTLVDKEGKVSGIVSSSNLPTLLSNEPPKQVGEEIESKTLFALEIIYDLFYLYKVDKGEFREDNLIVTLPEGIRVIFPTSGDRERLLGALRLILSTLKDGEKDSRIENVSEIDLRFKNPVLR